MTTDGNLLSIGGLETHRLGPNIKNGLLITAYKGHKFLIVGSNEEKWSVDLTNSVFEAWSLDRSYNSWRGVLVKDLHFEVDLDSVYDIAVENATVGSLILKGGAETHLRSSKQSHISHGDSAM